LRKLNILAVHRYYWPDTPPYAAMLQQIVQSWSQQSHSVEVLTSQPSYKNNVDHKRLPKIVLESGIEVHRMSLPNESGQPFVHIYNAIRLGFTILFKVLFKRYDVIMISTSPPVLGGWFAAIASKIRDSRFIYHCMDVHPEIGRISGEFSNPAIFSILSKMDNFSCRVANPVVVLSEDMARAIRSRVGCEDVKFEVINNFSLPANKNLSTELPFMWNSDAFIILFAGNIGRFQGLDTVIDAMEKLRHHKRIEFIFMGEGAGKEGLQKRVTATGAHVRFVGQQSIEIAKAVMKKVDLGFVSLTKGVIQYAYPSKTMTYLEQGCPIIVAVEEESELVHDARFFGYGCFSQPGNADALAALFLRLSQDEKALRRMSKAAFLKAQKFYSMDVVLKKWSKLLTSSRYKLA
jgi:colanic acid biosynthesis glycosyl transferase WcaI